ncbi:MAG: hypothetical protein ABSF69_14050 [Polyangiaceae bacterium]|jgi:hypothetical protein
MTRSVRRVLFGLAGAVVIGAACIAARVLIGRHTVKSVAPDFVPASWAQTRTTPGHRTHVGGAKAECRDCHDFERDGFKNPGTAVCTKCHTRETGVAHHGSPSRSTDCLTCHAFAIGAAEPTCIGCHAGPEGRLPAIVQHATVDCTACHRLHETPSIVPADCTSCHRERAPEHDERAGSKGCLDCHSPHEPASAAKTACATCHAQGAEPHPSAHDACVGCHEPHGFVPKASVCVSCHGPKTTLVASEVTAHAVCVNCHNPHAPGAAAAACARCHQDVQVSHGNAAACVSCHRPHTDDPTAVAATCTSCHEKVAATDTGAHRGGIVCEACHKPHAFEGLDEKTLCRDCHVHETTLVASNPGHADCVSCHGTSVVHVIAAPAACGTCHAAEQKFAPAGHQRCVGCHDPHGAQPTPPCASCHADKTRELHGAIPGGCGNCHRAHGPGGVAAPPACTTCHAPATLPALHAVPGHAVCARCHVSPHEPPRDDRATCTASCHTDRGAHEPGASVCTGCHVFRAASP